MAQSSNQKYGEKEKKSNKIAVDFLNAVSKMVKTMMVRLLLYYVRVGVWNVCVFVWREIEENVSRENCSIKSDLMILVTVRDCNRKPD